MGICLNGIGDALVQLYVSCIDFSNTNFQQLGKFCPLFRSPGDLQIADIRQRGRAIAADLSGRSSPVNMIPL